MNKAVISLIVAALLVIGFLIFVNQRMNRQTSNTPNPQTKTTPQVASPSSAEAGIDAELKQMENDLNQASDKDLDSSSLNDTQVGL